MGTLDLEAGIVVDRHGVVFILMHNSRPVECVITRAALETHFWLTPDAADTTTLKIFRDGYRRIHAVAQRKLLANPTSRLGLRRPISRETEAA
ncbi:DUF1488 family protein [Caballeronia arationis]|uniref:DUF1488 family protein n=1 Tax=Caballeronia arationis TaxID=1777142 RepID=UPI0007894759|nr:DUF1488 family protein [Caballeronia arationis]